VVAVSLTKKDGIVAALQVLAALRERRESLAEACADLSMFPQKLINVRFGKAFDWRGDAGILTASAQAEKVLNGKGRVLLRPSGTEPLLRVMVEGEDEALVLAQAEAIAAAVRLAASHA
jgi:phosphoglucosamine mutase